MLFSAGVGLLYAAEAPASASAFGVAGRAFVVRVVTRCPFCLSKTSPCAVPGHPCVGKRRVCGASTLQSARQARNRRKDGALAYKNRTPLHERKKPSAFEEFIHGQ
jgi:hypothetical protein